MKNRETIKIIVNGYNKIFNTNFRHIHEVINAIEDDFKYEKSGLKEEILAEINDLINKQRG